MNKWLSIEVVFVVILGSEILCVSSDVMKLCICQNGCELIAHKGTLMHQEKSRLEFRWTGALESTSLTNGRFTKRVEKEVLTVFTILE